jgi:hypothetical protein
MFNKLLPILFISLASCVSAYADTTMADADTRLQGDMTEASSQESDTINTAETGMQQNADGTYSVAEPATSDVAPETVAVDNYTSDSANYYTDPNAEVAEPAIDASADADPNVATDDYMTTDASYGENSDATQAQAFTVDATGDIQVEAQNSNAALEEGEVAATTVATNNL